MKVGADIFSVLTKLPRWRETNPRAGQTVGNKRQVSFSECSKRIL